MNFIKNTLCVFMLLIACTASVFAEPQTASANFVITLPDYISITPTTSPVLTANITDRTGNLYFPLSAKFKVISNRAKSSSLYLKSEVITDCGLQNSMFTQGGQTYIAFGNLSKIPQSWALTNCKNASPAKDSPGVVAYPIISINGAPYKYLPSKDKYELTVENGTTYIDINVGSNVLKSTFSDNDPKGFYQAILSLTETDI